MVIMKQPSKDPCEMAYVEEQDMEEQDSPIESPTANDDVVTGTQSTADEDNNQNNNLNNNNNDKKNTNANKPSTSAATPLHPTTTTGKNKEDEEEEEEENMDMELGKFPSSGDPDKMAKMQSILSQFPEEQMSRYESFRRSGFQKANMKKHHWKSKNFSTNDNCGFRDSQAKMFVGELVETARMVMNERRETGPIRPCHIREAYRRLKLEGKIPKKSVPRLFR